MSIPFLTCDYGEDPKKPPTKFEVRELGIVVKVADYANLQEAWCGLWRILLKKGVKSIPSSSIIDYLFMDGLLKDELPIRAYQAPDMITWVRG